MSQKLRMWLDLVAGACCGAILTSVTMTRSKEAVAQAAKPAADLSTVAADVETLKAKATDQSHVMQDVSYHFSNLWFAGQHENWDLANFYASETKSHLRWAVRVIPVRKDKLGKAVELQPILEGLENGPLKDLLNAIAAKDKSEFETRYRRTMEACYGCHKAADKPFLRPQIPSQPESPIINFDPHADWPR